MNPALNKSTDVRHLECSDVIKIICDVCFLLRTATCITGFYIHVVHVCLNVVYSPKRIVTFSNYVSTYLCNMEHCIRSSVRALRELRACFRTERAGSRHRSWITDTSCACVYMGH